MRLPWIRRLALHIEDSLIRGTAWAASKPNGERLWARLRDDAAAFTDGLFRQGAFQGTSARDAYFVRCGRDTVTAADIEQGVVDTLVGFAPLRPAEFVVLRIHRQAGKPG